MSSETPTDTLTDNKGENTSHGSEVVKVSLASPPRNSRKKRLVIEDDFFSLSSFSDKKSKKKLKSKKQKLTNDENDSVPNSDGINNEKPENSEKIQREEHNAGDNISPKIPITVELDSSITRVSPSRQHQDLKSNSEVVEESQKEDSIKDLNSTLSNDLRITEEDQLDMSFINSLEDEPDDDSYKFTEENERKRMYIIKVFTKLPTPKGFDATVSSDFGAKGTKLFGKILDAVNENFKASFARKLKAAQLKQYDSNMTSLIWVEGKMEIKSFFKPSTLRIEPPQPFDILANEVESMAPTFLTCILIPKENVTNYLTLYPEFKTHRSYITPTEDDNSGNYKIGNAEGLASEDETNIVIVDEGSASPSPIGKPTSEVAFFVIGLKGKDNKRIEVEVSPKTPLRKLLIHYLKVKELDLNSINLDKVKLVFDDEIMNLDDLVEDTELEEDFEVQVVL